MSSASSSEAIKRRPSAAETHGKFLKKVQLLESWALSKSIPEGVDWPRGPAELQRWNDQVLGLESWESPNVAAPSGKYADLRERFDKAVKELLRISGQEEKVRDRIRHLEESRRILMGQVMNLDCEVRTLRKSLRMAEQRLQISMRTEAELVAQLSKIRPLKPATR